MADIINKAGLVHHITLHALRCISGTCEGSFFKALFFIFNKKKTEPTHTQTVIFLSVK